MTNKYRFLFAVLLIAGSALAQERPVIESIDPAIGLPAGGTVVTIRGKHFNPIIPPSLYPKPLCTPCPGSSPIVRFGGKHAFVQSFTDEEIVVKTPPSAGGFVDVQVSNAYIFFGGNDVDERSVVLPRAFQYGTNELDRLMIPVIADRVPGAFGSIWSTELVVRNDNESNVRLSQSPGTNPHTWPMIPPNSTFRIPPNLLTDGGAAFLLHEHIPPGSSLTPFAFNLRIRDLSRQADSWGTQVPLVRPEDAFINRAMMLLNVPFEPESRLNLRVYDLDGPTGGDVQVFVFDNDSNTLLGSTVLHFPPGEYTSYPMFPGVVSVDVKSIAGNAGNVERVRVQVGEKNQEKRLWSILSVTDLETQQVTVITPTK